MIPVSHKKGKAPPSRIERLKAPIRGWNARDPLEAMKPEDAIVLENWIPGTGGVTSRAGVSDHVTGIGSPVETLMEYAPPDTTANKLFAAAGTSIYDVTNPGAVGAAVQTSLGNAKFQHTMITNGSGSYLYLVNGASSARTYDGSSWATQAITGPSDPTLLVNVALHKNRLWFCEENKMDVWYLGTSAIAGAATKFPLGGIMRRGGEIMAIGTWSRDGGDGADDLWVAVSSKGEVAVYGGTDPASADTWGLVGVFLTPPPIGRRCLEKAGADLGVLTVRGLVSLEGILSAAEAAQQRVTLTDRVSGAFTLASKLAGDTFGWQAIQFPSESLIIVNVPQLETGEYDQYIMSGQTGAWAKWTGINAVCWALFNEELYCGGYDGTVSKYGAEFQDDGVNIVAKMQTAYTYLASVSEKVFKMVRPLMQTPIGYFPQFQVRTDYDTEAADFTVVSASSVGSIWDEATWDVSAWGGGTQPNTRWQSVRGIGSTVSVAFAVSIDTEMSIQGFDIMYEPGGVL